MRPGGRRWLAIANLLDTPSARRLPALALVLAALSLLLLSLPAAASAAKAKSSARAGSAKIGIGQSRSLGAQGRCVSLRKARARARSARRFKRYRQFSRRLRRCRKPRPAKQSSAPVSLYWGALIGDQITGEQPPWDLGALSQFEGMVGKSASLVHFMAPFANCASSPCSYYGFPADEMEAVYDHGAIPFFSWSSQAIPAKVSQPDFQLADVIAGTYDDYIREWALDAKAWGRPFFLRFNWEMNGNWFAWSERTNGNGAGEYVAAWRHVHDIFTSVGATNATWVWCPMIDPGGKLQDLGSLYPGDAYVDWTSLDGYNWGTNPARPDRWRTFDQLYESTYREVVESIAPEKPMVIGEVGSSEYGGSKAAWISEMLNALPTEYPKIRGLLWFDKYDDGMDWPLETSSAAVGSFASGIQSPSYVSDPAVPGAGPIQPPS